MVSKFVQNSGIVKVLQNIYRIGIAIHAKLGGMKKFEKFLFFYSIIAITTLFVSFGVFSPKPLNLVSMILIVPIVFYFWIKLTTPEAVSADKWSIRFLTVLTLVSSLTIFGYYLAVRGIGDMQKADQSRALEGKLADAEDLNKNLSATIASISAELTKVKGANSFKTNVDGLSVGDLILDRPNPITTQEFTGRAGVKLIIVYDSPTASAKNIATLDGTQTYLYLEKQNDWYKVVLSGSNVGWVSASQVQEVGS